MEGGDSSLTCSFVWQAGAAAGLFADPVPCVLIAVICRFPRV